MLNIAIVTNTLAPYRTPVFSALAAMPGVAVHVFSCVEREPNRQWDYAPLRTGLTTLQRCFVVWRQRYIHSNLDVVAGLRRFQPDVVVTDGFNPTHLYAFAYCRLRGIAHVAMTDGTLASEQKLTPLHRWVRRRVYAGSQAFVAASAGGHALYDGYGVSHAQRFTSCLAIDNQVFARAPAMPQFDLLFCGRLEAVKRPGFVLEMALALALRCGRQITVLMVGSGSQMAALKAEAARHPDQVAVTFSGFASQHALPALYRSARLFVMPTSWEPWGVVFNEACAAGLPILTTPAAGAVGELVLDGENGYVDQPDAGRWAERAAGLLADAATYQRFAARSQQLVAGYTYDQAAQGLRQACLRAWQRQQAGARTDGNYRSRPRVLIVERQLLHYRVGIYVRLRELLAAQGMELQLLVGEGTPAEKLKRNEAHLDWVISIPTRYFLDGQLCWQPYGRYARGADIVIVMHENKILYNLWLMFVRRPARLAFWGHGANLQSARPDGWRERFKRWTITRADWWFAYTDLSAALIAAAGFPSDRTTVVRNAIDTTEMVALCQGIDSQTLAARRQQLGLGEGPVAIYLGSLYKEKRLDFLLAAALEVRRQIPDFQLLVVGAGPEQALIDQANDSYHWIHALGALQGEEKALALRLSDVMLNPGLVGLGILDSFAGGTPMFTTDCGLHSPEIVYLENGVNGVMTADDRAAFAAEIVRTLLTPSLLARLRAGARRSAAQYTLDEMAGRLSTGIEAALASL
ncbi:glycosyltransferase [Duganella sp. FT80W]|uniref:Glycosyltransferase n=1 Tax=Duganella guangzhouensis TaxID=2666084 RepID=A0A6I2KWL3_9BURK|nr:glycosyltransferase family 4 protein [Duganella guangzhouensis]MRW89942.1 glycosyltransferase [Duganella guangzhouensis]